MYNYCLVHSRHEAKDMKLKLAEAHLKLGEVGLETGNAFMRTCTHLFQVRKVDAILTDFEEEDRDSIPTAQFPYEILSKSLKYIITLLDMVCKFVDSTGQPPLQIFIAEIILGLQHYGNCCRITEYPWVWAHCGGGMWHGK